MNIALIGATGFVGTAVLNELLQRGHHVTAIARDITKVANHESVTAVKADIYNEAEVTEAVKGLDAVVSAFNSGWSNPDIYDDFLKGSRSVQSGTKAAGIKRYLVVGGAGSLYIAPGVQLIDTPEFPEAYKAGASAAKDYLNELKNETELDWTFLSPAIELTPGERTGTFRTDLENPVFDAENRSRISVEDLAVAIVDEIEQPLNIRRRFTVGY
ncbi:NAD(P)-dependent oxidoreductase [Ferruginibacter sp. HRS2-29]|uniref:NAD(P)-dependent oxidoreductase n=1 Tax=Ferruginibacter sp. HRS2-29 TaxID=2487334 RepID=UPI0020CC662A|nr:NAD(P)-dependent oxidoreductase [Ferruginibacter sp. HRS2-29]MCP9752522.1 NAD(P)-dependent oxidoreductase [Ferruginibacter sp. HRS2-29]